MVAGRELVDGLLCATIGKIPVLGKPLAALLSTYVGVAAVLCLLELALNVLIVWRVPYTEIDWKAYMEVRSRVLRDLIKKVYFLHRR